MNSNENYPYTTTCFFLRCVQFLQLNITMRNMRSHCVICQPVIQKRCV